jgi:O-antigen/teichoic acid export membrane protein
MNWWLGAETAKPMIIISQIIFFGIWINGIAYIPYALLQAQGRPDIVAKFHALELVPFLAVLAAFVYYAGLPGAAMAWTFRVAIDAILLLWASKTIDRALPHYILDGMLIGFLLLLTATIGTNIPADAALLAIYVVLKFLMNSRSGVLSGGVRELLSGL